MKSKSLKFKLITFAVFAVIAVGVAVNIAINNNNNKNKNIKVTNDNTDIKIIESKVTKISQSKAMEIKKQQENLEKMWKIGYDEFFAKQYKQAIETENKVIKEDPNFYKGYAVLGIALAYSGDFTNGMEQIDQSLKLKPDYGYARFNKALANELFGHYDEAIKWYKKDLEVEKFEWSYYGIASIYGRKGDVNNTIKNLKLAIEINPNVKNTAKGEADFDNVRQSTEFKKLIGK
ncbi:tetratricopeptide repeat protein [Clostridium sp.]|uniref:tetratricopeptide repeat protein n=1 Tax=Clostridium sp. TaxID=1506 RepID=UPI003D6CD8CE